MGTTLVRLPTPLLMGVLSPMAFRPPPPLRNKKTIAHIRRCYSRLESSVPKTITLYQNRGLASGSDCHSLTLPAVSFVRTDSPSDADALPDQDVSPLVFNNPSPPICNQGQGKLSNFTCILCSSKSVKGTQDSILFDSDTTASFTMDPLFVRPAFARLDLFSDTLMELSAIPFLFRTPSAIDNSFGHQITADNWVTIEDELGGLVTEDKLDCSHLGSPDLPSMDLFDCI
ncbi:hypothetical protein BS17DRAFT_346209 [Gyrodon lividus]|nr:hypothetical protein BS17DRAFT_346209 [Gyrodon lividus]